MLKNSDSGNSNHFIVIVPGYMGSLLRDKSDGEIVWLDVPALLRNPTRIDDTLEKMKYPNDNLEPVGIMERGILYALPWAKLDHYGRLINHLVSAGYQLEPDIPDAQLPAVYRFPYDWRQDNRKSGKQLGNAISNWRDKHNGAKAWIIGHSNGGIISRWYIEKEGGKEDVERLLLMGSPWDGAPKSMRVLFEGYNIVGRKLLNYLGFTKKLSEIIRTFPSYFQLIPSINPFLYDTNNHPVDPFENPTWLPEERDREYLLDGQRFNQELGTDLSVYTVCYFGRKKPTTTTGLVTKSTSGMWQSIEWLETSSGDGTVPESSAVHPQADERHAFAVDHGSIYFHEDVLAQLEYDLSGGQIGQDFATLVMDKVTILFETDLDFYAPQENIHAECRVTGNDPTSDPILDAKVSLTISWREPLPGDVIGQPVEVLDRVDMIPDAQRTGSYYANFPAPNQDGTYTLKAQVIIPYTPKITIEEVIAVERLPTDL